MSGPTTSSIPREFQDLAVLRAACGLASGTWRLRPMSPSACRATSEDEDWSPAMSSGVRPASRRLEHPRVDRVANLRPTHGKITIDQYGEAIVPRPPLHQRMWHRGRG